MSQDQQHRLVVSVTDMEPMKALIAECIGAECRHAGEPYAGADDVACSDECGGCRVRTMAWGLMEELDHGI